jgi:hypothetical protein
MMELYFYKAVTSKEHKMALGLVKDCTNFINKYMLCWLKLERILPAYKICVTCEKENRNKITVKKNKLG